ncbi:GNAT family N-acetyltransferase [Bdellovibrio sp. HCB337]|uniref:GNAT family N-acetyltransferase n=1 Tax=Bdellovibrio sp. HCB337 TaxID=3394358 RepID=UPI0039A65788
MIKLRKMTSEEYTEYRKFSVANYADEKQKGEGLTPEEALKVAQDSYERLLPQGLETPDQFLFSVIEDATQKPVGMLWFAKKSQSGKIYAFIYDVVLNPEKRGQGLGKHLIALMEEEARALGCKSVGLHVFGHNTAAIALYEKSGFHTTNRMMKKDFV